MPLATQPNFQRATGLFLDKEQVRGYDLKMSGTLPLPGQDISGTGSSTARAEQGDKAKELNVGLMIAYVDEAFLVGLLKLAQAKDGKDERKVYTIVNRTAQAFGIKQVRFEGDVSVNEEQGIHAWQVSFKLVEYHSTAEKKETRGVKAKQKNKPKVMAQTKTATKTVVPIKSDPNDPNALSQFDKVLKGAEERLK